MSEVDLPVRLNERYGGRAEVRRIALTRDDVEHGGIPSFPVAGKWKDARFKWWHRQGYGDSCWELDALSPVLLRQRVEQHILALIDDRWAWERAILVQTVERKSMIGFMQKWTATLAAS